MISTEAVQSALQRALRRGGDFADCFVEQRHAASVSMEDSRVERVQAGTEQGAGIRVVSGLTTAFAYTDDITPEGLLRAAEAAAAAARGSSEGSNVLDLREQPTGTQRVTMPPDEVDTSRKVDLLRRADEVARAASGDIRQVTAMFAQGVQTILVANSDGTLARDRRTRVRLLVQAVAARDGEVQSGMEAPGSAQGFEYFESGDEVERAAREAAERAAVLLDADPAPAGTMPVVLGNGFGGVLFHEASGHGLEADAIAKRASVFAGHVGEMVASPLVTAVDDGTVDTGWGTLRIDDEGVPTRRNVLIEEGVLTGYMFDRLRARQDGRDSTGNGRRQSYQHIPMPRMTNTFILPGLSSVEELIEATPYGLYAKKLGSGQVNPVTGDFVFAVTEGYLIENGRITRPVRNATIIGNGPAALKKVDMVANDLALSPGTCGKEGQSVPVSVGQPHLRIPELTVGGTKLAGGVQM
ncbi:MAG TPA: TldD/PmbA family protein [Candidatus Angelobacter sp.]|jgi:TldD protein|nr:TldD/PmbA family protein [Candidatus Angelobacter sp.]